MTDKEIRILVSKWVQGSITEDETKHLDEVADRKQLTHDLRETIRVNYIIDLKTKTFHAERVKTLLSRQPDLSTKKTRLFSIRSISSVAAVVLVLVVIPFIWKYERTKSRMSARIANEIVKPGTNKAVLTLEDGRQVELGVGKKFTNEHVECRDEQLQYKNSSSVKGDEEEEISYNYVTIPRGGQFNITLADGTIVWLNSESQLRFPVKFPRGRTREVELLYGEAYFEVSPASAHEGQKFAVHTTGQTIDVFGTQFNLKAYQDEPAIYTTLVEGKISLTTPSGTVALLPGEQSTLDRSSTEPAIRAVDANLQVAWKNGLFVFDKMKLDDILHLLSRWYNVTYTFDNETKKNLVFSGLLVRSENINELLDKFQRTEEITFEISSQNIIIY